MRPAAGSSSYYTLPSARQTAALATAIEFITPLGIDNITIPILTTLFVHFVLL